MKLSNYIQELQEILDQLGDTELMFQARDAEGNGYNRVHYSPSICYVPKYEMNSHVIEECVCAPDPEEDYDNWLGCNGLEDANIEEEYVKGVLL